MGVFIKSLPSELRALWERRDRKREWSISRKQCNLNIIGPYTYELTEPEAACPGPEWFCIRWGTRSERRSGQ